jgi:hypothetical protein
MNLGPQHCLEPMVSVLYQRLDKEFCYKRTATGSFVSRNHLKNPELGAAINTFRRREEARARFPLDFWQIIP